MRRSSSIVLISLLSYISIVLSFEAQDKSRRPQGVIAGRVVDEEGRPMRGVQVQALVSDIRSGRRELQPRGNTATTNDRGEFRLFALESGSYYVLVNPSPLTDLSRVLVAPARLGYIPSDPGASYVTTYFPGTPDVQKAEPVQVGASETDVRAIQVAALPSRRIRMRIMNSKLAETTGFLAFAAIYPLSDSSLLSPYENRPRHLGKGELEMQVGLMPGSYRLVLGLRTPETMHAGSATVTIDRADPDIIPITVAETMSIQGQVLNSGNASSLTLRLAPLPSQAAAFPVSSEVRTNGRFVLQGILPGAYAIAVDGLDDDAYISEENIDFPPDVKPSNLTVSIKHDGGSVSGIVIDETRAAQAGAVVVLMPSSRLATANGQGEFQMRGIPPGSYSLFAVQDLAILKRLEGQGMPLTITSGGRLNLGPIRVLKP